jgi:hypothetical protein
MSTKKVDYWFNKSIAATAVEPQKTFFAQVDPKVKPYMDSGQLKTFEGATEFFPGFREESSLRMQPERVILSRPTTCPSQDLGTSGGTGSPTPGCRLTM